MQHDVDEQSRSGAWIWQGLRDRAAASGEQVLWESTSGHGRKGMPLPEDFHGQWRWVAYAMLYAALGLLAVGAGWLISGAGQSAHWPVALIVVGTFFLFMGRKKVPGRVLEDSEKRHYLLTDRRLLMVGQDSHADIPFADMEIVYARRHRDGRGTVFCHYDSAMWLRSICIEGIEDFEEVEGLIKDSAPALLKYRLQLALPVGIKRRVRQA